MTKVTPAIASLGRSLLSIGSMAAIGFAAASAAAAGFFTKAVFDAALFRERMSLAFGSLRGMNGTQAFEELKQLSLEMNAPLQETAEQMKRLTAAGFDNTKAVQLFKRGQDLMALGQSADEVSRAMLAISQIKSAGTLQGDELNQLAEAGIGKDQVYAALAKNLGKTREEIIKLKETGKISSDDALLAIEDVIKSKAGGKAAGELSKQFSSEAVGGAIQSFKSLWSNALDDIAVQAAPAFREVGKMIREVLDAMKAGQFNEFKDAAGEAFNATARAVRIVWDVWNEVAAGFAEGMEAGGLEAINAMFRDMAQDMDADTMSTVLRAIGKQLAIVATGLVAVMWLGSKVGQVIVKMTEWAGSFGEAVMALPGALLSLPGVLYASSLGAGTQVINGLVQGIRGGIGRVAGAASEVASSISSRFTGFFGIASPSKLFAGYGMNLMQGLDVGVRSGARDVAGTMTSSVAPKPVSVSSPSSGLDFSGFASMASGIAGAGTSGGGGNVEVNINVSGAGPNAEEEWQRIAPRVRREVQLGIRTAGGM